MPLANIIRETPRLRLRWATPEDDEFFLELLNDPDWLRLIGDPGVRDLPAARAFIDVRLVASYREHGFGLFVTELRGNSLPIGLCGFIRRAGMPGPDLGFAFLPAYRGSGLAHEAAAACLEFGREELGFERALAITRAENAPSIRLLERLGLRRRRTIELPGIPGEQELFERAFDSPPGSQKPDGRPADSL